MAVRGSTWLLSSLMASSAAAATLIGLDAHGRPARDAANADFQRLVGGLGFGPATDLSGCRLAFDPRIGANCSQKYGPLPAGEPFCPEHSCSILFYPAPRDEPPDEDR